jgi:murein DD-endopeptidase MepM/ murein hydrolase activator NlpD
VSHALVLLIAATITGYSAGNLDVSLRAHDGPFAAHAAGGDEVYGGLDLNRDTVIIKPLSIPTQALPDRKPIAYRVRAGDTLDSIARGLGIPFRELTWSNPGLRLPLQPGQVLLVPPVQGVVVAFKAGDTLDRLATIYGVDASDILGFNHLRARQLVPGTKLVIPVDPSVGPNLSTGEQADPIEPEKFLCPILGASIIQKFGPSNFVLEPPYGGYLHFHSGIDLLAGYGTPINAAAGGKVTATGYADYFGTRVEITDSYGLVEIYAHMEQVSVSVGQEVQQGEKVGLVGSTGLSIGAHLHFQLEAGGAPADPGQLFGC